MSSFDKAKQQVDDGGTRVAEPRAFPHAGEDLNVDASARAILDASLYPVAEYRCTSLKVARANFMVKLAAGAGC